MKRMIVLALVVTLGSVAFAMDFKQVPRMKAPQTNVTAMNRVVIDKKVWDAFKTARGNCPAGQWNFYLADWDIQGFCGILNDTHCLPHYIYVPEPSGSVNEHSEGEMVWIVKEFPGSASVDGNEITGGYVCVKNKNDSVFTNPPPPNACSPSSMLNPMSNQLQYQCDAKEYNKPLTASCVSNYTIVSENSYGSSNGQQYFFNCGLNGFKYNWQNSDYFAPCGNSGARNVGGSGDSYCCAYTE